MHAACGPPHGTMGRVTLSRRQDPRLLGVPSAAADELCAILDELTATAIERDATHASLEPWVRRLAAIGLGTARLSPAQGGWGLRYAQLVELIIVIARADSSAAQVFRSHFCTVERAIHTPSLSWLVDLVADRRIVAGATTETGNQTGQVQTRVTRTADGALVLNGRKAYTTACAYADHITVLVSDDTGAPRAVTVSRDDPGVTILDDWHGVGQRSTRSGSMVFENVPVEGASLRGVDGSGSLREGDVDAILQLTHLATMAGIALRVVDDAVGYLRGRRRHFSHAAAATPVEDPLIQLTVGRLSATAATAVHSVLSVARELEEEIDGPGDSTGAAHRSVTQIQVVLPDLILAAAQELFDVGGGSMVDATRGFDRHWRNVRTLASHNPAAQKARSLGAEALLGATLPQTWYAGEPARKA